MARKKDYGSLISDHNLPYILRHGLRSRSDLADADFNVHPSDTDRLDQRDDAISVSISCYAPAMFDAKRHRAGNAPWAVLILRPEILWRHHCLFFRQGAATNASRYERGKRYGGYALEKLFDDFPLATAPGTSFRAEIGLPPSWPTHSDAEVQVMAPIDPRYIMGAWVERPEEEAFVRAVFGDAGREDYETIAQLFAARLSRKPYYWG